MILSLLPDQLYAAVVAPTAAAATTEHPVRPAPTETPSVAKDPAAAPAMQSASTPIPAKMPILVALAPSVSPVKAS